MGHGIYTATAGAIARQTQLDVVANNLANVGTTGYRAQKVSFEEVLTGATSDAQNFVVVGEARTSPEAGALEDTGNALDLSLVGGGYFGARAIDGSGALIRSGSFQVSSSGVISDRQGRVLMGSDGILTVDPDSAVEVNKAGEVLQDGQMVGRLAVIAVADERYLKPVGHGAYTATPQSGPAFEVSGEVVSGALETSNVQPVQSMVQMIELERDYQSLLRAVNAYKDADERLIRMATQS